MICHHPETLPFFFFFETLPFDTIILGIKISEHEL